MIRNLENKVAWITGAGSGIGRDASIKLSKLGMKVILSGRNKNSLQDTQERCKANTCLLYTSPSPRDMRRSRMPSSA